MPARKPAKRPPLRAKTFKEKHHGLTPSEYEYAVKPPSEIVSLMQQIANRTSGLSRRQREIVEMKFEYYKEKGLITKSEDAKE